MLALIIALSFILTFFYDKKDAFILILSSSTAMLLSTVMKIIFHIPRPGTILITETSYRFPSGHATMAAVVSTLIIYYTYHTTKKIFVRISLFTFSLLWTVLICYSRIYLHAHIFVDVFVGVCIGSFVTLSTLFAFEHFDKNRKSKSC